MTQEELFNVKSGFKSLMGSMSVHKFESVLKRIQKKDPYGKHLIVVDTGRLSIGEPKYRYGNPVINALRAYLIYNDHCQWSPNYLHYRSGDTLMSQQFQDDLQYLPDLSDTSKTYFSILDQDDARITDTARHIRWHKEKFNDLTYNLGDNKRRERPLGGDKVITQENTVQPRLRIMITSILEGLDLKGVKHVHFLDPPLSLKDYYQAIGRAVRTCSFVGIPEDMWIVKVYEYFSTDMKDVHVLQKERREAEQKLQNKGIHPSSKNEDDVSVLIRGKAQSDNERAMLYRAAERYFRATTRLRDLYLEKNAKEQASGSSDASTLNVELGTLTVFRRWLRNHFSLNPISGLYNRPEQMNRTKFMRQVQDRLQQLLVRTNELHPGQVTDVRASDYARTDSRNEDLTARNVNVLIQRTGLGSSLPTDWATQYGNMQIPYISVKQFGVRTSLGVDDVVRQISKIRFAAWKRLREVLINNSFDCEYNRTWNKKDVPHLTCASESQ